MCFFLKNAVSFFYVLWACQVWHLAQWRRPGVLINYTFDPYLHSNLPITTKILKRYTQNNLFRADTVILQFLGRTEFCLSLVFISEVYLYVTLFSAFVYVFSKSTSVINYLCFTVNAPPQVQTGRSCHCMRYEDVKFVCPICSLVMQTCSWRRLWSPAICHLQGLCFRAERSCSGVFLHLLLHI